MSSQFQQTRQFRKQMAAAGYVYNTQTKQYEPRAESDSHVHRKSLKKRQAKRKRTRKRPPVRERAQRKWHVKSLLVMIVISFLVTTTLFDQAFWRGGSAYSILFVGTDTSEQRTDWKPETYADALIYVTIEPWQNEVTVLPINRDLVTTLACSGEEANINHAYLVGGNQCLRETITTHLGLPVDYYVETNFNGFVEVIDALGGITLTPEKSFCEQNAADESDAICFEAGGTRTLDGEAALAYARHRKSDNLAGRQRRQEQVLQAVIRQAFQPATMLRYPLVIATIWKNIATNLTPYGLGLTAFTLMHKPEKVTLEYSGTYEVTDNYHFYPDQAFWDGITQLQAKLTRKH